MTRQIIVRIVFIHAEVKPKHTMNRLPMRKVAEHSLCRMGEVWQVGRQPIQKERKKAGGETPFGGLCEPLRWPCNRWLRTGNDPPIAMDMLILKSRQGACLFLHIFQE